AITKSEQYGVTDIKPWEKAIYDKKVAGSTPAPAK
ncbi:MAG: biopolymer transporter ExbD, partial [Cloacibacterium normanense]